MAKNAREHLHTLHENERTHHVKSASFDLQVGTELSKLANTFAQLEEWKPGSEEARAAHAGAKEILRKLATQFQEHAQHHEQMSKLHGAMKEGCEKSVDTDDLNKLMPTGVSAIADPSRAPSSRLVPRTGQPTPDMPKVTPEFEHLVRVE
jgi:hypothetical protein